MAPKHSVPLHTNYTLSVIFLALFLPMIHCGGRSKVVLRDNGYRDLLIAITDDVTQDEGLLERIVEVFTEMSAYLYHATRKRSYLHDITVLLPESWGKVNYPTEPALDMVEGDSDIRVGAIDKRVGESGDKPVVLKVSPCGQLGQFMYLTPTYLKDKEVAKRYGPYGKALVHSWGHLRYGVFDEYPTADLNNYFYASDDGIEATRCSRDIEGELYDKTTGESCVYENGYPDKNCRFRDKPDHSGKYGSLMYRQYLPYIDGFCDNDTSDPLHLHNPMSRSKQNIMCDSKSVWEVLRAHGDFDNGQNPPRDVTSTVPNFRWVRHMNKRTVLVLDISDSMRKYNRLRQLRQASCLYLSVYVEDGEEVGIVTFNSYVKVVSELTTITSGSRRGLIRKLPRYHSGYTAIGGGILEGIAVLSRNGADPRGGNIILVTDGNENRNPRIRSILDRVENTGVIIDTIAVSPTADNQLEELATLTGGTSYFYSEKTDSNGLNDAFVAISERGRQMNKKRVTLNSLSAILDKKNHTLVGDVIIDSTLSQQTKFSVGYISDEVKVTVTSPSGKVIGKGQPGYSVDADFGMITVTPQVFEAGKWKINVTNSDRGRSQKVTAMTSSKVSATEKHPIVASAQWAKREITYPIDTQVLYLAVSKGLSPILNANVSAILERPGAEDIYLDLRDNGAGADISKDDGVYSSFVTQFSKSGRYSVSAKVNSSPITVVRKGAIVAAGGGTSMAAESDDVTSDESSTTFQRNVAPGSFMLKSFVEGIDKLPPSKITDLTSTYDADGRMISLAWTAVGDNLDSGTVRGYELQIAHNFTAIHTGSAYTAQDLNDSNIEVHSGGSPQTYGYQLTENTRAPRTLYFRLRAVDHADNWSKPSNIASVYIPASPTLSVALIVLITMGTVAIVALVIVGVVLALRRRKGMTFLRDFWGRFRKSKTSNPNETSPPKVT